MRSFKFRIIKSNLNIIELINLYKTEMFFPEDDQDMKK